MSSSKSPWPPYREVSPGEVQARIQRGDPVRLVDVRQDWEYAARRIPGAILLPLSELPGRFAAALDPADAIICLCEHGIRSRRAAHFLAGQGYKNVATMTGGMAEYTGPAETNSSESLL